MVKRSANRRRRGVSIVPCLISLSSTTYYYSCFSSGVSASPQHHQGGIIRPPPPPPPPHPHETSRSTTTTTTTTTTTLPSLFASLNEGENVESDNCISFDSNKALEYPIVEELDGDHDWTLPTEIAVESGNEIDSNIASSTASLKDNVDPDNNLIWDDGSGNVITSQQQQQQQQQQYYPEWGIEQTISQHNYHDQWQQHQQQQHDNYQQQHEFVQKQQQKQQQLYPQNMNMNNQWQRRSHPQPPGQLVLHNRRNNKYYSPSSSNFLSPTARAKFHAASNILSRTVKKLQNGIVSETISATNMVSSTVSTISSRIGTTMLGSSSASNNNGNGGNVRIGHPPQQRNGAAPGPRQQQQQQQRQSRPVINDMYAPPMSELFSFGKDELENNDGGGGYSIDNNDYYNTNPQSMENDSDDDEDEEKYTEITMQQWQSIPMQSTRGDSMNNAHSTHPSLITDSRSTTEGRRVYQYNNDEEDDDYTTTSSRQKLMSILTGCIPRLSTNLFRRHSSSYYDDGSWSDDEAKESSTLSRAGSSRRTIVQSSSSSSSSSVVVPRQVQSLLDKRNILLSSSGTKSCISIGRTQAVLDACQLALVVYILHEAIPLYIQTLTSSDIRTAIITTLLSSILLNGWAPYALVVILLLSISNSVWVQPSLKTTYADAALENTSNVAYTQLYLRLLTSQPISKSTALSDLIKDATRAQALQVASTARLRSFVTIVSLYVLLSTVAVFRPAMESVISAILDVVRLDVWKILPIDWTNLSVGIQTIGKSLGHSLRVLLDMEMNSIQRQPLLIAMVVSLLASFIAVSYLPYMETRRKSGQLPTKRTITGGNDIYGEENDDEDSTITTLWSNIGSSSASRLHLLSSSPRGVEGALEQFAKLRPDRAVAAGIRPVRRQSMRKSRSNNKISIRKEESRLLARLAYSFFSLMVLSVPLVIHLYFFVSNNTADKTNWVSLFDLTSLLVFTYIRTTTATNDAIQSNIIRLGQNSLNEFFHKLAETVTELTELAAISSSKADYQTMTTASTTEGIIVKDLWASHSSRRAWAVKGVNIQCRNGEVCLILGVEGSGKTRLLTAIAEQLFTPPKTARVTTYVRGSINISGVDVSKWDRKQLHKRVGVVLNDVRIVSDYASLLSGCSLEEILEPIQEGDRAGPKNQNSLSVAMKVSPNLFATI